MHIYYTFSSKLLQINFLATERGIVGNYSRKEITLNNNILKVKLNKNGLYLDGTLITDYKNQWGDFYTQYMSKFATLTVIKIGAEQGTSLSNATYNNCIIREITN